MLTAFSANGLSAKSTAHHVLLFVVLQAAALCAVVADVLVNHCCSLDVPVVIAGDFNSLAEKRVSDEYDQVCLGRNRFQASVSVSVSFLFHILLLKLKRQGFVA